MQFLQSYFFIVKPKELIALLTATIVIYIYIYIYIHFRNMKKDYFHLFALVFLGFYRILFALVAYLQNIKQNVIHLLWSRRWCTKLQDLALPQRPLCYILLDETQLCIKCWEYGLNEKVWNYYFGCLDKFQSLCKVLTVVKVLDSLYNYSSFVTLHYEGLKDETSIVETF